MSICAKWPIKNNYRYELSIKNYLLLIFVSRKVILSLVGWVEFSFAKPTEPRKWWTHSQKILSICTKAK